MEGWRGRGQLAEEVQDCWDLWGMGRKGASPRLVAWEDREGCEGGMVDAKAVQCGEVPKQAQQV